MDITIPGSLSGKLAGIFLDPLIQKRTQRREQRARLDSLKRRLAASSYVRNFSAGLIELRKLLLEDAGTLKDAQNRAFFAKWCQHSFVELGWTPGEEFWSRAKCADLLTDLETVRI